MAKKIRSAERALEAPRLFGQPIAIRMQRNLRDTAANPAHAATFIRERLILLDTPRADRDRILWHEIFHFAWVRLGNTRRRAWEELLTREFEAGARGEAGWSAEWRKQELIEADRANRTRRWREYVCESFCDTAAWLYSGSDCEMTLARRWRAGRKSWFNRHIADREIPI